MNSNQVDRPANRSVGDKYKEMDEQLGDQGNNRRKDRQIVDEQTKALLLSI